MTLQETLADLDRLEAMAHKAPWAFEKWHNNYMDKDFGRVSWEHASYGGLPVEDAEFIVSMRNAYPALRANIERLQGEVDELTQACLDNEEDQADHVCGES